MSRDMFRIEKGIHIVGENSEVGIHSLFGSGVPGSQAQENNAEVGSTYSDTASGYSYIKKAAGSGTDKWERIARYDDLTALKWRSDSVIALTSSAAPVDDTVLDLTSYFFVGDEVPLLGASDFTVGDCILFGFGGTEKIMRVSNVSGDEITVTSVGVDPLAAGDTFIVKYYLMDSPDAQEKQAIVLFNGSDYIKISDVNWEYATGIKISAGYTPGSGNPSSADSVESALQKVDGNVDALNSLTGRPQGATALANFSGSIISDAQTVQGALQELETDLEAVQTLTGVAAESVNLGSFTGSIIPDNVAIKPALQSLESAIEDVQIKGSASAVTTAVTLDSVLVDNESAVEWFLKVWLDSDPTRAIVEKIHAMHDGTASSDAANVDDTAFGKIKTGSGFNYTVSVDLNGAGAAQVMRLRLAATSAVSAKFIRRSIDF